jgi:hypothetical protein
MKRSAIKMETAKLYNATCLKHTYTLTCHRVLHFLHTTTAFIQRAHLARFDPIHKPRDFHKPQDLGLGRVECETSSAGLLPPRLGRHD